MIIGDYDYKFAYTTGAYCSIYDLHLSAPRTTADQVKIIRQMAVIMSDAYEMKQKIDNPEYKMHKPLTLEQINALSVNDVVDILTPEINAAVEAGKYRTVESEPIKN